MSLKHLSTGSTCPPSVPGLLRCYSNRFCPYAQRPRILLLLKNVEHDIVNIHLKAKPEWFPGKSPLGKVPSLEVDGQAMIESLVICDYLDEAYPEPPLYPADPWRKGRDRMFMEMFNKVPVAMYRVYFAKGDQQIVKTNFDEIRAGLDPLEAELKRRNTTFFGGDKPGMLDYMIWPWMERIPVVQKLAGGDVGQLPNARFPKLLAWMGDLKNDAAVKATYMAPETHFNYMQTMINGTPDYEIAE